VPDTDASSRGALARARTLAEGIAARLRDASGLRVERDGDRIAYFAGDRPVARLSPGEGALRVEVDPRAGVGNAQALRRLGTPHPDPARSSEGWRLLVVRTRRDAADVVHALRAPRVKSTGEERRGFARAPRGVAGIVVGGVRVRRAADGPSADDGARVLVDRFWPRGLAHEDAMLTAWMKEVAPSPKVREAYGVAPARLRVFRRAYLAELRGSARAEAVSRLRALHRRGPLTLLTAVRDVSSSPAAVLAEAVSRGRTPHA
jgi:uncharacterized protein YeaO (DUF488 family)